MTDSYAPRWIIMENIDREIEMMKLTSSHRNFVLYYADYKVGPDEYVILSEFVDGGDLTQLTNGFSSCDEAWEFVMQMSHALM